MAGAVVSALATSGRFFARGLLAGRNIPRLEILPNKHAYMATGYNGQMVMVFPDLDVVAVTTARDSHNSREFANFVSAR